MTEAQLHKAVARFLSLALPPDCVWTTFPAGGGGKVRGAQLKARGLRAGWPDIQVIAEGRFIGIELKAGEGYVSAEQTACHIDIRIAGGESFVCRSVADVERVLRDRMKLKLRATAWPHAIERAPAKSVRRAA